MASQTVLHYRIIKKLGEGGMGQVYLAEDTRLGRKVALKLLPPELTNDEHRVRRFQQEARAASALNHPNILTIYDIGEVDAAHFIATEYVKGSTLREYMADLPMKWQETLDIAIQVASALSAAHEVGIVHRDIKPENIMLRPDDYVKVLDFGLAKLTEKQLPADASQIEVTPLVSTEPGVVMGTPRYMSPEQVRGFEVDGRSDIFSLGVMLYEMITGKPPFEGPTTSDVIAAILKNEPTPITHYVTGVPDRLQQVISKTLRKDAQARYQTVAELLADLKRIRERAHIFAEHQQSTLPLWNESVSKSHHTTEKVFATPDKINVQSDDIQASPTLSIRNIATQVKSHRKSALMVLAVLVLAALAFILFRTIRPSEINSRSLTANNNEQPQTQSKLYARMTEAEQITFVEQQAQRISAMLGERPTSLNNRHYRK